MNKLYDVLEVCLQELEKGADMESVLARYPDLASELRPILNASTKAWTRSVAVSAPSPEVIRHGRAKLLQRASEMREAKAAPRRRMIPLIQRLAISFSLTALFLASGTGLVGASSSALPGEKLYPVKLTWEGLRLFFTFDHESRELLEDTFENERLHEINELLVEGRHETIQFTGVFTEVNGQTYVSGIRIVILDTTVLPAGTLLNGTTVIVTGRTNAEGFVDVESIQVETQHNQNGNDNGRVTRQDTTAPTSTAGTRSTFFPCWRLYCTTVQLLAPASGTSKATSVPASWVDKSIWPPYIHAIPTPANPIASQVLAAMR